MPWKPVDILACPAIDQLYTLHVLEPPEAFWDQGLHDSKEGVAGEDPSGQPLRGAAGDKRVKQTT